DYIRQHFLDDKVAAELRKLSPPDLEQVMASNITNARNPSAIVISRIGAVKAQSQSMSEVETYLQRYPVDESAARALRELDPQLQAKVVEQEMSNCRNPSAVLLSRIRKLQAGH
ncbi:unnamed protein product, partial [Polarella glacialis]